MSALRSEPRSCRIWVWLIYVAALLGGMAISFQPMIFSGFKQMQSDTVDSVLNHYKLEHTWRWLSDRAYPASFWSPQFFYPTPYTLTYSENMVGVAPFYWVLR